MSMKSQKMFQFGMAVNVAYSVTCEGEPTLACCFNSPNGFCPWVGLAHPFFSPPLLINVVEVTSFINRNAEMIICKIGPIVIVQLYC